jgi:hypothetical protein
MFGKIFGTKSTKKTPNNSSFKPGLENLEARQLMAANLTASLVAENGRNILVVEGTERNDSVYIEYSVNSGKYYVGTTYDGEQLGAFRNVAEIRIWANGGNDRIDLHSNDGRNPPSVKAIISGGDGNDILIGGTGDDHLDGGAGNDKLYGGAGADLMGGQTGDDELYGLAGNDVMYGNDGNDYLSGGAGIDSIWGGYGNDDLRGDSGGDSLYGDAGADKLRGGTGADRLFGGSGVDELRGETSASWGDSWQRNWLEAGSASESAVDGWNAHKPVVNGTRYYDIDQEASGTCVLLSSLAAVTRQGADLSDRVQYLGNFKYRVSFENGAKTQDVFFDGNYVKHNGKIVDANSHGSGESWTIIYQRAYLKQYFNIDPMNAATVYNFGGEDNNVQAFTAIGRTHIVNKVSANGFTSSTRDQLRTMLANGYAIGIGGTGHRYALFGIEKNASGVWTVELYNPWGSYGVHKASHSLNGNGVEGKRMAFVNGSAPGRIKVEWAEFKRFFNEYTASAH